MDTALTRLLQPKIEALKVLVVDDDQYMRKVVRTMLNAIGVKTVYEAPDGASGLEAIRRENPDLVIVDWEMPLIDGAQFVRLVRSPGEFPMPDVAIIGRPRPTVKLDGYYGPLPRRLVVMEDPKADAADGWL